MERLFVIWFYPSLPWLNYPNSFKMAFDLWLINAIDLHYRHRKKYLLRPCAHLELKETKNITHFILLKAHPH